MKPTKLAEKIQSLLKDLYYEIVLTHGEVTLECTREQLKPCLTLLKQNPQLAFEELIDICGVDYLDYGIYNWETEDATTQGFSRGREIQVEPGLAWNKPRFAVVYHLLSITHNHRVRVKVYLEENDLIIPSVHDLWKAADWFEREAYDLYGILFEHHPDLRRILTDYGFIGHPFRKDFPISGYVEMRYDAKQQRVIYEPVDIEPRVLVPKVIREDNRYQIEAEKRESES